MATTNISDAVGSREVTSIKSAPDAGTTKFVDDAEGLIAKTIAETQPPGLYDSLTDIPGCQTLIDFLKKPTLLQQGVLTATDTGVLWKADPWGTLMASQKGQKLAGVFSTQFKVVVTMQVNANRFQQGRYILGFMPSGGAPVCVCESIVTGMRALS